MIAAWTAWRARRATRRLDRLTQRKWHALAVLSRTAKR